MNKDPFKNDELLDSFESNIHSVLSDQMHERDDIFLMPVRNRRLLLKYARDYFEFCETIPPDAPVSIRYYALKEMLANWRGCGEDVDRLLEWYKSLRGWGIAKQTDRWCHMFWWWSKGWYVDRQKNLPKDRFDAFMKVVNEDYVVPKIQFEALTKDDEPGWIGDDGKRTEWDEYLWKIFIREVWTSPYIFYDQCFWNLNIMSFWKKHRYFLSPEEQALLLADMFDVLVFRDQGHNEIDWDNVATLEDTLTIDNWPDFDKLKRDW
tara:strand:+ start:560 stop:1351 length:792 start_codon:yes stop_codon:yes gene_type:complete